MKSIIIISHALELGGAERALLGLLEAFDYSEYNVDLFLMRHEGELLELLPKKVKLLPEIKQYTGLAVPIKSIIKKKMWNIAGGRLRAKIKARRYVKKHHICKDNGVELEYSHKYTLKFMPNISNKKYDLAISFLVPHYFAINKVKAKKKIAWIHTDYSYMDIDIKSEKKMWERFDHIMSISDDCTKGFVSKFPDLKTKIIMMENIISPEFIKKQSEMLDVTEEMISENNITLLSIGRFSVPKNFDNIPDICRRVVEHGINIKWFLIGYGGEEELINKRIKESGMEQYVIILGKKKNPYPYIKKCDIYVQPSRYEGKCVAVREAQILGKPVIITNYPTSSSQLMDGIDGIIVPLENSKCAEGITNLLTDNISLEMLRCNTNKIDYSNVDEIKKIYSIIN